MDCKKADEALLQYAEKIIKPETAAALAKHVLTCEPCREMFLAFDEALEESESFTAAAPTDFTDSVMTKVRKLPAYVKVSNNGYAADMAIRVFWGLCALFLGFGLLSMGNPEALFALLNDYPQLDAIVVTLSVAGDLLHALVGEAALMLITVSSAFQGLALSALFFVVVAGAVLAALLRGENVKA